MMMLLVLLTMFMVLLVVVRLVPASYGSQIEVTLPGVAHMLAAAVDILGAMTHPSFL